MKYLAALLASAALAAAHGWIDNATIGGKEYQFYQPYLDPYTVPAVRRNCLSTGVRSIRGPLS